MTPSSISPVFSSIDVRTARDPCHGRVVFPRNSMGNRLLHCFTWMNVDVKALSASTRHFHIASRRGDNDKKTAAVMMTNVNDNASSASARHFYIALRSGDDYRNNYWQQQMTSVGWRGLVREKTYSNCVARWRQRRRSQAHMLRAKHRCTPTSQATSNIDAHELNCQTYTIAHIAFISSKPLSFIHCAQVHKLQSQTQTPQSTFRASCIDAVMGPDKLIDGYVQH